MYVVRYRTEGTLHLVTVRFSSDEEATRFYLGLSPTEAKYASLSRPSTRPQK